MEQVQEAYERSHRTYGYRRIVLWLQKQKGAFLNHKTVLRLTLAPGASAGVNKLNIRSVARKRKVFRMAKAEIYHHYDNVLNQEFRASQPNQKWVTEIVFTQMTKTGVLSIRTGWDNVANFDFIVGHNHAIN